MGLNVFAKREDNGVNERHKIHCSWLCYSSKSAASHTLFVNKMGLIFFAQRGENKSK